MPDWGSRVAAAAAIARELRAAQEWKPNTTSYQEFTAPTLLLLGSESPEWAKRATETATRLSKTAEWSSCRGRAISRRPPRLSLLQPNWPHSSANRKPGVRRRGSSWCRRRHGRSPPRSPHSRSPGCRGRRRCQSAPLGVAGEVEGVPERRAGVTALWDGRKVEDGEGRHVRVLAAVLGRASRAGQLCAKSGRKRFAATRLDLA